MFEREVSLSAKGIPLEDALREVARQGGVELDLDREGLAAANLDLTGMIDAEFERLPLGDALGRLIDWSEYPGVYRELRGGKLFLSTLLSQSKRVKAHLPEWLKPLDGNGLSARLDEKDEVAELYAHGPSVTDGVLAKLKSLPRLRKLTIGRSPALTRAGLASLAGLEALESLEVQGLDQAGGLGDDVIRAVAGLQSLRELSISESGTSDAGAKLLEEMPWLTRLHFYQEGRLTDTAIASIAKITGLKSLILTSYVGNREYGRMSFTPGGLDKLQNLHDLEILRLDGLDCFTVEPAFPKLRVLSVGGPQVDDAFATSISGCRRLRSLTLSHARVTDAGLEPIATLPKLRQLVLDDLPISDAGLAHLRRSPRLEHIELRRIDYTDAGVGHLAAIKTLNRLDLGGSRATVAGLGQLESLPELRTLWLFGFRGDGYAELARLKGLRDLHFEMCSIDEPAFHALESALPKAEIRAGTGGGFLRSSRPRSGYSLR